MDIETVFARQEFFFRRVWSRGRTTCNFRRNNSEKKNMPFQIKDINNLRSVSFPQKETNPKKTGQKRVSWRRRQNWTIAFQGEVSVNKRRDPKNRSTKIDFDDSLILWTLYVILPHTQDYCNLLSVFPALSSLPSSWSFEGNEKRRKVQRTCSLFSKELDTEEHLTVKKRAAQKGDSGQDLCSLSGHSHFNSHSCMSCFGNKTGFHVLSLRVRFLGRFHLNIELPSPPTIAFGYANMTGSHSEDQQTEFRKSDNEFVKWIENLWCSGNELGFSW